jgi:PhnB protein
MTMPEGWHNVTPRMVVRDVAAEVRFLQEAFGAAGELQTDMPSVMRIGDSNVMVSGAGAREAMPAYVYLYVEDVDATYRRALEAGGVALEDPRDLPYGDRRGMVEDPGGSIWQIATHIQDVAAPPG